MIDFIRYRKTFYIVTGLLVLITIIAVVAPPRLPWGLEFTSGSALELRFVDRPEGVTSQDVQRRLEELGIEGSIVQAVGDRGYFIRIPRRESSLEPVLQEKFGAVSVNTLNDPGDLATIVSFVDPVPEADVRAALTEEGQDLKVSRLGEGRFFITGKGQSEEGVRTALKSLEERYGAAEALTFQGAEHMAVLLDFGPAVPTAELETKVRALHEGFRTLQVGQNAHFVYSTDVPQDARTNLVPTLEAQYGRARVTAFDQAEDMAMVLTFTTRPAIQDIRSELIAQQAFSAVAVEVGDNQALIVSKSYKVEEQDKLFTALKAKFGADTQRGAFNFGTGMATTVDFGGTVEQAGLRQRLAQINAAAIATNIEGNTYFVGGRGIPEAARTQIISSLESGFGLAAQTPVDFNQLVPLEVTFTDPVQLTDINASLAAIPIKDTVGDRATVQSLGKGSFLLVGRALSPEAKTGLITDLENAAGKVESTGFEAPGDLHVALDFGPATTLVDVRALVNDKEPEALLLESIAESKYLLVGGDIPKDRQDAVLAALEERFGPAKRIPYNAATDLAVVLKFAKDTAIGTLRAEITAAGVTGATVAQARDGTFYVAAKDVPADRQQTLMTALKDKLGDFTQTPFDFSRGIALGLDFGQTPDVASLRALARELALDNVHVESAGGAGFFVGARALPEAKQQEFFAKVEERFGIPRRNAFPGPEDLAVTVTLTDPEKLAQIVRQTVIVHKLGPNEFFLAQTGIAESRKQQVFSALQSSLGTMRQEQFDFNLGLAANLTFPQPITSDAITSTLTPLGYTNLVVEQRAPNTYFVRSDLPEAGQKNQIVDALEASFGPIDRPDVEFSFVDAEIARRSVLNTTLAVALSSIGILLYVWYAFRRSPKPFRYGVSTLVALLHDVVLVIGVMALMAKFRQVEIDSLMIIGILAVIGFSVNNTIVVIDRVRENLTRFSNRTFEDTVNISLNETLSRNLNTTVTTVLAILAVLLFGGPTIFNFMLVLLIGILAGMYSSLFLATPLLASWEKGELLFGRRRKAAAAP